MGNFRGHVAPGLAFCTIGFWHLFNHTRIHAASPKTYVSLPWFPTRLSRHLELYFIAAAAATSISMELFIMPRRHHPLDTDATIPANHLHNFEHSNISLSILSYALFALLLDRLNPPAAGALTHLLGVVMLAQEFLLFHLHSADHAGLEGQYHWLLQLVIFAALAATLASIRYPRSFLLSFARSLAVAAQGVWLVVIGFMLYTPALIPKGCLLAKDDGHDVIICDVASGALDRAKSLANILFSYYVVGVSALGVAAYLVLYSIYSNDRQSRVAPAAAGIFSEDYNDSGGEEMKGFLHGELGNKGSSFPVPRT
ncbi:uncharacterized protein LOC127239420 [Andrographis paniculata]|uniref:uncharacterized protein LOC127239420 n=1 Tax=Andrographis paniculata TaxID=175694 RepID=UPI0021E7DE2A|nr:uncharacterized protein LOC127239420 [Andrographis paniculata]